jgi:membrane protein DedA with SNARE-associated domain
MEDIWAEVMRLVSVWGLWVLLPVTIVEGPVATVIAGWLIKIGALPVLPAFAAVLAGDVIGDLLYYAIGHQGLRRMPERWRARLGLNERRIIALSARFDRDGTAFLIAAKLSHGAGAPVLAAAGMAGMRLLPFVLANTAAGALKAAVLLAVGYILGQEAVLAWLLPAAALVAAIVLLIGRKQRPLA